MTYRRVVVLAVLALGLVITAPSGRPGRVATARQKVTVAPHEASAFDGPTTLVFVEGPHTALQKLGAASSPPPADLPVYRKTVKRSPRVSRRLRLSRSTRRVRVRSTGSSSARRSILMRARGRARRLSARSPFSAQLRMYEIAAVRRRYAVSCWSIKRTSSDRRSQNELGCGPSRSRRALLLSDGLG
jgi:hypothetical protein